MVLSLGGITIGAGALLGYVYSVTKAPIEATAARQQQAAIAEVAPPFNNNPEADRQTFDIDGAEVTVYPAIMDGKLAGAAVKASSFNGFSGEVTVMCGFDDQGNITDYRVLQQAETPGLGAKMEAWFRDPAGARSVIGRNPGTESLYVVKDVEQQGVVDGITAATISSRAFLETLRTGYEAYVKYAAEKCNELAISSSANANTGASPQKHHS